MRDFLEALGNFRVTNLAESFGVLADTVEVVGAAGMMLGGIFITHRIQKWADRQGDHPGAVNTGKGGGAATREANTLRD